MFKLHKTVLIFVVIVCAFVETRAQSLSVGNTNLENYYRSQQLAGLIDSNLSLMIRPIFPKYSLGIEEVFYPDPKEQRYSLLETSSRFVSSDGKTVISLLPVSINTQINSHHAYGWNDGAMIPAKGFQTLLSGGVHVEYGPLTVQFAPELLHAENRDFEDFNRDHYDIITAWYYDFYNRADLPVRFGSKSYSKAFLGQSSVRLNYKKLSFGISTENLWWGPGQRNALLMSNNAPGFAHLTLNTLAPIESKIGSFEGQIIAGRLEGSGFSPLVEDRFYFNSNLNVPKREDWRYLSGLVLSYQPKWVPGLFLGMAKTAQMYSKDLKKLGDYLPFSGGSVSSVTSSPINTKDFRSSYFMRWLWPEEKAEIYFEFGRSNFYGSGRELALKSDKSRAYTFGVRKLFPWGAQKDQYLMMGFEASQLQQSDADQLSKINSWYVNDYVRHGYTHKGEVLGAGIGPGGNLQSLDLSWVSGFKTIGLQLERRIHNNDLYLYFFRDSRDFRRHWTDLSIALNGNWNVKNFLFNAQFKGVKSINYQWYLDQNPGQPYMTNGKDVYNMHMQLGASYRF